MDNQEEQTRTAASKTEASVRENLNAKASQNDRKDESDIGRARITTCNDNVIMIIENKRFKEATMAMLDAQ